MIFLLTTSAAAYSSNAAAYSASAGAYSSSAAQYSASSSAAAYSASSAAAYSANVAAYSASAAAAYSSNVAYSSNAAAYSASAAAAYSSNVAYSANAAAYSSKAAQYSASTAAAASASAYSANVAASAAASLAAYSANAYSQSAAAYSASTSAAGYSASVAAAAASAAAYSANAYSQSAAVYSVASSAAAYSASVAASAAAYSGRVQSASAAAYSASVAASAAAYSAGVQSASAAAYSASVAASAAAYSAGVYSASAAAYSANVASSASAYSASVAASAAAYSANVYSASAAAYSAGAASSAAAYSSSISASAAAFSASAASYSASVSAAAAAATVTPSPWVAATVACVAEGTSGRALIGASTSAPDMTFNKCLTYCANNGFAIAGLEYSNECYCGNALVNGASLSVTSGSCNMACGGSSTQTCGGPGALTIFVVPSKVTGLDSNLNVKTAALPSGWSAASTTCIAEGTTGRALTGAATASSDMTGSKCAAYCANLGFQYAGVEYGQECYCGNSIVNGASLSTPSNACNMNCGGDVNSICGGPGALTLYTNPSIKAPVTASTTPVSGTLPSGWSAASAVCIQEVSGRALTGASTSGSSMTTATCLAFCQTKGFQYAGLEYGQECYCGAALTNGASLSVTSNQCNMACAADSTATCGGPNAVQLYVNPSLAPAAPAATVVNGFTSSGCIQEVSGRALTGMRVDFTDMTLEKCTSACANAGFKYAGIEYGQECYCGNSLVNNASTTLTSGQCVMPCPGNSAEMCGGPNAIQLLIAQ